MDISLKYNKGSRQPSDIKNPFLKDGLDSIIMSIRRGTFDNTKVHFTAHVECKNGNTTGSQKIDAESFADLVSKIEAFINQLQ